MEKSKLFRITTKAVIFLDDKVVLLRKPSGKWDLPGGKLDDGEEIEVCLAREVAEEMGVEIGVGPLLQCNIRRPQDSRQNTLVVTHLCTFNGAFSDIVLSMEHTDVGLFCHHEIDSLDMRTAYCKLVQKAFSEQMSGLDAQHVFAETGSSRSSSSFFQKLKARWSSS